MAQKLNKQDLGKYAEALSYENNIKRTEIIDSRQNPAEKRAQEDLEKRNIETIVGEQRGVVSQSKWVVIKTITGEYEIEEVSIGRANKNVTEELRSEIPFGRYVKSSIVKIVGGYYNTEQEAIQAVISLKTGKGRFEKLIAQRIKDQN